MGNEGWEGEGVGEGIEKGGTCRDFTPKSIFLFVFILFLDWSGRPLLRFLFLHLVYSSQEAEGARITK